MGRKRTTAADPDMVLACIVELYDSICSAWVTRHDQVRAIIQTDGGKLSRADYLALRQEERELDEAIASHPDRGMPYDLDRLAGRALNESERVQWRKTIRGLFTRYLVDLDGARATHLKPTDQGREYLAELQRREAATDA